MSSITTNKIDYLQAYYYLQAKMLRVGINSFELQAINNLKQVLKAKGYKGLLKPQDDEQGYSDKDYLWLMSSLLPLQMGIIHQIELPCLIDDCQDLCQSLLHTLAKVAIPTDKQIPLYKALMDFEYQSKNCLICIEVKGALPIILLKYLQLFSNTLNNLEKPTPCVQDISSIYPNKADSLLDVGEFLTPFSLKIPINHLDNFKEIAERKGDEHIPAIVLNHQKVYPTMGYAIYMNYQGYFQ